MKRGWWWKKKNLVLLFGVDKKSVPWDQISVRHHLASLVMPNSDTPDRFFSPHQTPSHMSNILKIAIASASDFARHVYVGVLISIWQYQKRLLKSDPRSILWVQITDLIYAYTLSSPLLASKLLKGPCGRAISAPDYGSLELRFESNWRQDFFQT